MNAWVTVPSTGRAFLARDGVLYAARLDLDDSFDRDDATPVQGAQFDAGKFFDVVDAFEARGQQVPVDEVNDFLVSEGIPDPWEGDPYAILRGYRHGLEVEA